MDKLKIVFLDFDGVISTPDYNMCLEPEKVALVEKIVTDTGAKIVVTSSWASGCQTTENFISKNFQPNFKSIFIDSIYDIIDDVEYGVASRGEAIKIWLENHEDEIDSYVIIDDTLDMLDEQLFNFVQTDDQEGITSREVKLATRVLNHIKVPKPFRLNMTLQYKWYDKLTGKQNNLDQLLMEYYNGLDRRKK